MKRTTIVLVAALLAVAFVATPASADEGSESVDGPCVKIYPEDPGVSVDPPCLINLVNQIVADLIGTT